MSTNGPGRIELPPRPDPNTGRPRPPEAPREFDFSFSDKERRSRFKPKPPDGQGPVLEWYKDSQRNAILAALITAGIFVVVATVLTSGFGWVTWWWFWLFILGVPALVYHSSRNVSCAAGAEWFANGPRWVRIYALTSVTIKMQSYNRELQLVDRDDRKVEVLLMNIQQNPELWNLVYNGIRHSVADGAETNQLAQRALHLGD